MGIGFANSGRLAFMDKSAEEIATLQAIGSVQRSRVSAIGRNEVERAVLVVMATVDAEHVLEMTSAEDEDPVEAVGAERSYPAFGVGVRVRRLIGVRITLMPSVRKTSSKAWLNFASQSWIRNRKGCSSPNCMTRLRACCPTQRPSGCAVEAMHSIGRAASEMKNST